MTSNPDGSTLAATTQVVAQPTQAEHTEEFQTGKVALIALGHLAHDTYPAFLAPLLPLLTTKLGLSLALAGSLGSFLRLSSVAQPFLGYLADRTNVRLFIILAPACTGILMSALGLAPTYLALIPLLVLTSLSSACFHAPAPAMITRVSGRRLGKGMSFFMLGGELGRAIGPVYAVVMLGFLGLDRLYLAAVPGIVASLVLYRLLAPLPHTAFTAGKLRLRAALAVQRRPLLGLMGVVAVRSLMVGAFPIFLPSFLMASGTSLALAGGALTAYELAGAAGAFAGGSLSDSWGRRQVLIGAQLAAVPLLYASLHGQGWTALAFLVAAGPAMLSSGPVQLAILHEIVPDGRSTATGLYFSFSMICSAVFVVLFGALADAIGLLTAFRLLAFVPLLAVPFALALPETRHRATRA